MAIYIEGTVSIAGSHLGSLDFPLGAVLEIESEPGIAHPFVLLEAVTLPPGGSGGVYEMENGFVTVSVRGHLPNGWVPSGELNTVYGVRASAGYGLVALCMVHGPFAEVDRVEPPFLSVAQASDRYWNKADWVSAEAAGPTLIRLLFNGPVQTAGRPTYTVNLETFLLDSTRYSIDGGASIDYVDVDPDNPNAILVTTSPRVAEQPYTLQHPYYYYYWPFDETGTFLPLQAWPNHTVGMYEWTGHPVVTSAAVIDQPYNIVIALGVDTPEIRAALTQFITDSFSGLEPGTPAVDAAGLEAYLQAFGGYNLTVVSVSAWEPLSPWHRLVVGLIDFGEPAEDPRSSLLAAAIELLPPGRAFSRRLDSMIARVLDGLMREPDRIQLEARELLRSISPRRATRVDYVEAWEEALDITDPIGVLTDRALAVAQKLRGAPPDRSFSAWQAAAVDHGMVLTELTVDSTPFRVGESAVGDPLAGDSWAHAFTAHVVGEAGPSADALLADFVRLSRAHTAIRLELSGG